MHNISVPVSDRVLVGMETSDDAGVYLLRENTALIQTLDFITPIVDDPFVFGQIAAANSLSDIYAMGGTPITALNIVCFPSDKFSLDMLSRIIQGGIDIISKAGAQLLGGHSVEDQELKYGLSVTGIVDPEMVITNVGLKDGDSIILTKPLGTGIIGTAVKAGLVSEEVLSSFIESASSLNRAPAEVMANYNVHACTDVTGFGLAGHLKEMISCNKLEVVIDGGKLPLLPGAVENAEMGMMPGGLYRNRDYAGGVCVIKPGIKQALADIVFDPQTSGGLLIALSEDEAPVLINEMKSKGVKNACIIGRVQKSPAPKISIV